jgi:DNA recombination protein RmuC
MDGMVAAVAIAALLIGLAIGWFVATRPLAAMRGECDQLRSRCGDAERDLAVAGERSSQLDQLRLLLDAVTGERDSAMREVAGLRPVSERLTVQERELASLRQQKEELSAAKAAAERGEEERRLAFEAQLAQLRELEAKVERSFGELAGKALDTAHDAFLKRAGERMNLEGKEQRARIETMLQPVSETLKRYEEGLQRVEKERVDQYAGLREAVELVRSGQGQVRDETRNLVNALRSSPKARGRWGEQSLKNVLEQAGLSPHADFRTEVSVDTQDGRLRPDVIVRLPGGRQLIIDAKCSLNAYLEACEEEDETRKSACFVRHVASIRNHAHQLGSKAYWAQFGDAADYVVMYIPGEHFLTAALEQDPTLWDWAFERRVLLATPTNLVAIARTVSAVWQQERIAEAAEEIAGLGKELHSRLSTMAEHMARMGRNLATANSAYNQMVGSFESQVLTQARRFEGLGAGSAKEMTQPAMIEASPRPLTKIAAPAVDQEAAE